MLEGLFALLCVLLSVAMSLAAIAVIGHGLWVLAASVFSLKTPPHDPDERLRRRERRPVTCADCGVEFSRRMERCPHCGLEVDRSREKELDDLEASARTMQRLKEQGQLSEHACEQIYRAIEARQDELFARKQRPEHEETPIAQLEAWFGNDFGATLSVHQKKQALALARTLDPAALRELSASALVGIARLQTAVGMLSRACNVYRILLDCHPDAAMLGGAAAHALELTIKLRDWAKAAEFVDGLEKIPGLLEKHRQLAALVERVRDESPEYESPAPVAVPVIESRVAAPIEPVVAVLVAPESTLSPPIPVAQTEVASPEPRRSFAEWIAVFMEEKNILWGELIGGTLIVGCSIALVISLWTTLAEIEFFPFLIFAAITSGVLGAGFYTLHHWKLESTSRGLLLIGMLLVPLNFAVPEGLAQDQDVSWLQYVFGVMALALFGWMVLRAARILIQTPLDAPAPSAILTTFAILANAAMLMLMPAVLHDGERAGVSEYLISLPPVLVLVFVFAWILTQLNRTGSWNAPRLGGLSVALGSTTFACSVTLGFPVFISNDTAATLLHLSPALTLLGIPLLVAGTLMPRKLAAGADGEGIWRTAATGLALFGVFIMFGGFIVSMREPPHRWVCGLLNAGTLLAVACLLHAPLLHVLAQVYLGVLIVVGTRREIDASLASVEAALRMTGLMLVQALVAEGFLRWQRRRDALCYAVGSGVAATLAALLILPHAQNQPGAAAIVFGAAALTWLAANVRWRRREITYVCAVVSAAAILFAFRRFMADAGVAEQLLWSLLTHATLFVVVATALRWADFDWVHVVLRIPMQWVSLSSTFAVAGLVAFEQVQGSLTWMDSAVACGWLAGIWLTLAIFEGWPILFGAFQAALGFAWVFGAAGRLDALGWDLRELYSLHTFGVGLAALCLTWEAARIALKSRPRPMALLSPSFVPVDRVAVFALLIVQYALALLVVLFSAGRELLETSEMWRAFPLEWYDNAYSIWPWLLVALLAAVMFVRLRSNFSAALLGLAIVALTLPLLGAGAWFDESIAAASALRWGLALVFAGGSVLLWLRHKLGESRANEVPALALRVMFLAGAVFPALAFTLIVTSRKLAGGAFAGPIDGVFAAMGGPMSLLAPLALFSFALAGHGFRERLPRYLSAAGLLADASAVGGFFLALPREQLGETWVLVDALLVGAGMAWAWVLVWTWIASLLETTEERPLLDSLLLSFHCVLGAVLFGAVLGPSLVAMIARDADEGRVWAQTAGAVWTWLVFAATAAGSIGLFLRRQGSVPLHLLGSLSLTAVGVVACSGELIQPGQGFRALMFLTGLYACGWVCVTLFIDPASPPRWLQCTARLWEAIAYTFLAGSLAVLLAATSFETGVDQIWSAESIILVALACALLAYQRKIEMWATLATLLSILASTLVVVHFVPADPFRWLRIIHVDLAVAGAAALLQLALQRYLTPSGVERPFWRNLPAQIGLGMAVNLALLGVALAALIVSPTRPFPWLEHYCDLAAWLALATNVIAAIAYLAMFRPTGVVHGVAIGGLLFGVILAGGLAVEFADVDWLGHHVLTLAWTLLGLGLLIVSWSCHAQPALGPQFWPTERRAGLAESMRRLFPDRAARLWVTACGLFVVLLALPAISVQPDRPYWSIGNTVAVILLIGSLAVWARAPIYLYGAGLLFNVIGLFIFTAWSSHRLNAPGAILPNDQWISIGVLAQILSFGAASIVGSLLERRLLARGIDFTRALLLPYAQAAIVAGIHLLAIGGGVAHVLHQTATVPQAAETNIAIRLAWLALCVLAVASAVELWRPGFHRFSRYHLYTCGLIAIGLILHGSSLTLAHWYLAAMLLLAGYVTLIVLLMRVTEAWPRLRDMLHLPVRPDASGRWFWNVQVLLMMLVIGLAFWVTLTYEPLLERCAGALACAILTVAALMLVPAWSRVYAIDEDASGSFALAHRHFPVYLAHALLFLAALDLGWAFVDPNLNSIWLQRIAAALAVVIATTAVYRFLSTPSLRDSIWLQPRNQFSAVGGVLSLVLLATLIGYELKVYDPRPDVRTTPLILELKIAAAIAILGLAGLACWSILAKGRDVYGIEEQRRSFYVYLTEVLLIALFAHVRLNVQVLRVFGEYWYLVVMVLAFTGVALSEYFAYKRLPVLSVPLLRSATLLAFVPVLAFQLARVVHVFTTLRESVPGLVPFFRYLELLQQQRLPGAILVPMESLCWLLLAIFFGWQARLRQSANLGILAALALNFGVWVLLGHQDATQFVERPQLWLIPLGLIILVAEFVNRRHLGFWPSLSVRYIGLLCIYLSSTIEMIMTGLGQSVVLPILLALLAVAGVLLGILFRVRAFLLTGFMALFVDVFAQIWHAAVDRHQTWLWWASGIVLGVMILILFALFEKRRNDMLKLLDNMKRWQ